MPPPPSVQLVQGHVLPTTAILFKSMLSFLILSTLFSSSPLPSYPPFVRLCFSPSHKKVNWDSLAVEVSVLHLWQSKVGAGSFLVRKLMVRSGSSGLETLKVRPRRVSSRVDSGLHAMAVVLVWKRTLELCPITFHHLVFPPFK